MGRPSPGVARERRRCLRICEGWEDLYLDLAEKAKAAGDQNHYIACLARAWAAQEIGQGMRMGPRKRVNKGPA